MPEYNFENEDIYDEPEQDDFDDTVLITIFVTSFFSLLIGIAIGFFFG